MFLVFAVSIGYGIRLDLVFDWMWYSIGCGIPSIIGYGIRLDAVHDWMWYFNDVCNDVFNYVFNDVLNGQWCIQCRIQ